MNTIPTLRPVKFTACAITDTDPRFPRASAWTFEVWNVVDNLWRAGYEGDSKYTSTYIGADGRLYSGDDDAAVATVHTFDAASALARAAAHYSANDGQYATDGVWNGPVVKTLAEKILAADADTVRSTPRSVIQTMNTVERGATVIGMQL